MEDLWQYLKTLRKPIVLYGMGNGADMVLSVCGQYGIKIAGVFASDGFVRQKQFHGMPVTDYSTAKKQFGDMVVLLCFGTSLPEVIENIKRIKGECELYAPDVPVCGGGLFTAEYYKSRRDEFDRVRDYLADKTSKQVFDNIIKYKLSGDIDLLFAAESDPEEPFNSFFKLSDNEVYADLGAYRGDTVLSFCGRVQDHKKIVAVEPDAVTYKKLCAATADIKGIENINAFAGAAPGIAEYAQNGSRGAGAAGIKRQARIVSLDSLALPFTYIKADIEGDEAAAISGAAGTISRFKPKMQIAAYHRVGDIIDIPAAVLDIRNDYKIYLRRRRCLPAWDIDYFFI